MKTTRLLVLSRSAMRNALMLCAMMFFAGAAFGQEQGGQFVTRGDITVHYAAINSTDIPADTAKALGVVRSANRAVLVLNAQRADGDGATSSVPLSAEGRIQNLVGQDKAFEPRRVREADTWYLIAPFRITDGEQLRFDLAVTPEGSSAAIPLRFQQRFYRPL